jgi:ceramide glucosyltransferase
MELLVTPILFLITLMVSNPAWPLLTFGMFYLGEMLLAWMAGWYLSWRTPFAMIVRDILMMGVWITGWFGDTFHWAGQELSLRPIDESKPLAYPEDATL